MNYDIIFNNFLKISYYVTGPSGQPDRLKSKQKALAKFNSLRTMLLAKSYSSTRNFASFVFAKIRIL